MASKQQQNYINHIVMVLDMSYSMTPHARDLVKVADGQIAHLARRSQELDQETRITVYVFDDVAECVIYDKDVLRLPSIAKFYQPRGNTALIDASMLALADLKLTPEKYGDHAFLIYVLTDGEENRSKHYGTINLQETIRALPDHWTVAALVPNAVSKHEAKRFGFLADNIAIWNPNDAGGVSEVGAAIRQATDTFMVNRAKGVRSSNNLFNVGADVLNTQTVAAAGLKPVPVDNYIIVHVDPKLPEKTPVKAYVEDELGLKFRTGTFYYELTQPERIQHNKKVLVQNKKSGHIYEGQQARDLLGLPDMDVRVKPDGVNREFRVLIQSNSTNRHIDPNTTVLIMK